MAIREHDWDGDLRRRAKEEDCPIPQGFSERLEARLEGLPQGTGRPRRRLKTALVLAAALIRFQDTELSVGQCTQSGDETPG